MHHQQIVIFQHIQKLITLHYLKEISHVIIINMNTFVLDEDLVNESIDVVETVKCLLAVIHNLNI